jgi:NAD-dependent SIR2 family protein deacetylase
MPIRSDASRDPAYEAVLRVAEAIARAEGLLITAGAGMSVDSGLPDFRSPQGLWRAYPPLAKLGLSFEQMAQPHWFSSTPEMAWAWYGHRQQLYRQATPHEGHDLLHRWAQAMPAGSFVVTSNVDGQFLAAGFSERALLEVHGSVHRQQCTTPCSDRVWDAGLPVFEIDVTRLRAEGELPRCPHCGTLARPNVLMFNDLGWVDAVTREQQRRFDEWLVGLRGRRVVVLECGAGTAIPTIRRIGEWVVSRSTAATLVRVNPAADTVAGSVISLEMPALRAIRAIDEALRECSAPRSGRKQRGSVEN